VCFVVLGAVPHAHASSTSWNGFLFSEDGQPANAATIHLQTADGKQPYTAITTTGGQFSFPELAPGSYRVLVEQNGKTWQMANPLVVQEGISVRANLKLAADPQELQIVPVSEEASAASGGEHLSSGQVSSLPLNVRDFSKLLLLASGTMTDANGAANFTQQFAVNGQRGSATVFAMDGFDTTDPEMGGATFSNFNVDAIQEVQASSGVMPAEIGHGAASFTNVVTKSGTNQIHGSVFEFVRNAAFDARNYFDHNAVGDNRRIPPFNRNEFGFTNGGPVFIPHIYDGRDRTFYFGE